MSDTFSEHVPCFAFYIISNFYSSVSLLSVIYKITCQEIPASPSVGHLRCCVFYVQLLHRQLRALTSVHAVHELFQNLKHLRNFFKKIYFCFHLRVCVFVYLNMCHMFVSGFACQKRVLDFLDLKLQEAMSFPVWMLGTALPSSPRRAECALNCCFICPAPNTWEIYSPSPAEMKVESEYDSNKGGVRLWS